MTEWLTENARRAYPLEHELPDAVADRLTGVLLDACIGYDGLPGDGRIKLLDVRKSDDGLILHVGLDTDGPDGSSRQAEVVVPSGSPGRMTAYGAGPHIKALLTVSGPAVTATLAWLPDHNWHDVDVPFAHRCTSYANRFVTALEAYSPEDPCARPVFGPDTANLVATLTGDVTLLVKNGLDLEVTPMAPIAGDLLRLTAVTAPSATKDADKPLDMMIYGDECIAVEALPGYGVTDDGAIVPLSDPTYGVIRLTEKCKPCCQCEDYEAATKALRPGEAATFSVKDLLDDAKLRYDAAVALLDEIKALAYQKVNDYDHVIASAVAVASGGVTTGVTAAGTRCRIAVNLTVMNLALEDATISAVSFHIQDYSFLKVHWGTAGHNPRTGDSLVGQDWTLKPGDTLSIVATYTMESTTNTAVKPNGMTAALTAKLSSRAAASRTVEVL